MSELSFGEMAIGCTFNPSNDNDADVVKTMCAELANKLNDLRQKA